MANKAAREAMIKARRVLIMEQRFYGCLAMYLQLVENKQCKTAAVNGKHLFYNPDYVLSLTEDERIGLWAHEVSHCSHKHFSRRKWRDLELWNKACDFAINRDLIPARFTLPQGVLYDPQFDGMPAEEIYSILECQQPQQPQPQQGGDKGQQGNGGGKGSQQPQNQPQQAPQGQQKGDQGQGQGKPQPGQGEGGQGQQFPDPGMCGGVIDAAPEHDEISHQEMEAEWDKRARQAVAIAKAANAGKLPAELERIVQELQKPKVSWKDLLRQFIDESMSKDYSWVRPNRRFLHQGLYLPGLVADSINELVVVADTSGSIDTRLLAEFSAEIGAAIGEGVADKVTVLYADTKVHRVDQFDSGDEFKMDAKGGGGTDFRDSFRWVAENAAPSVVIYFTDLLVNEFGDEPNCPVLWATYGSSVTFPRLAAKVPFGQAIHIGHGQ